MQIIRCTDFENLFSNNQIYFEHFFLMDPINLYDDKR